MDEKKELWVIQSAQDGLARGFYALDKTEYEIQRSESGNLNEEDFSPVQDVIQCLRNMTISGSIVLQSGDMLQIKDMSDLQIRENIMLFFDQIPDDFLHMVCFGDLNHLYEEGLDEQLVAYYTIRYAEFKENVSPYLGEK